MNYENKLVYDPPAEGSMKFDPKKAVPLASGELVEIETMSVAFALLSLCPPPSLWPFCVE